MNLPIHDEQPQICRRLRTKQAFMHVDSDEPWHAGTSNTAAYWCLRTMGSAGPDEAYVHPHACRPGRGCFEVEQ